MGGADIDVLGSGCLNPEGTRCREKAVVRMAAVAYFIKKEQKRFG
jgi:hypothetical protein